MRIHPAVLVALLAPPVVCQTPSAPPARSPVAYARALWQEVSGYLTRAALDTPDSLYSYKPTPDVRSFGETLDHIAASQNGYCRLAMGQKPTSGGNRTGAVGKAALVDSLRASNELCAKAYAQSDQDAELPAYAGDKRSRLYQLMENATHDNEHYGNLVTYLRLNGRVPPSSQPAPLDSAADLALRARLKLDLQRTVIAQERYYAAHDSYAPSFDLLKLDAPPVGRIELTVAHPKSWAAAITHPQRPGKTCVIYVNLPEGERPATAQEKRTAPEGRPVCDGDQ